MKQYALKVGNTVVDDDYHLRKTLKEAQKLKEDFENANRAYDIPCPEKITIVSREVTSWKKEK